MGTGEAGPSWSKVGPPEEEQPKGNSPERVSVYPTVRIKRPTTTQSGNVWVRMPQAAPPPRRRRRRRRVNWARRFGVVAVVTLLLGGVFWVLASPIFHTLFGGQTEPGEEAPVVKKDALPPEPMTPALSFAGFNPGSIITDEQFFDTGALSEEGIAEFIAEWNEGCRTGVDGTPCLAEYVTASPSFEPDQYCPAGFEGAEEDTAASIIHKAAMSCGINPQVLLTTLQKEQGLITASGLRLNEGRYTIAMGYACPDSSNCDEQYFGFATQVYYAARQMRVYEQNPYKYMARPYENIYVPYAPEDSCGGETIYIENLATSNLYNYTPYQPNQNALERVGGPCASVGNLNFYAYFNAWFG